MPYLIASAALFSALYFPAIARWSRGLASPYAKCDLQRRMAAATLDGLLTLSCVIFYVTTESTLLLIAGCAYALLRDARGGQSVGKFFYSLMVIRLDTGRPAGLRTSVLRNVVLLIPGANIAAVFLEAWTVVQDPKGARLGDRIALTQVVDGFGARELVKILRDQFAIEAVRSIRKMKPEAPAGRKSNVTRPARLRAARFGAPRPFSATRLLEVARPARIELAAPRLGGGCSIP